MAYMNAYIYLLQEFKIFIWIAQLWKFETMKKWLSSFLCWSTNNCSQRTVADSYQSVTGHWYRTICLHHWVDELLLDTELPNTSVTCDLMVGFMKTKLLGNDECKKDFEIPKKLQCIIKISVISNGYVTAPSNTIVIYCLYSWSERIVHFSYSLKKWKCDFSIKLQALKIYPGALMVKSLCFMCITSSNLCMIPVK